MWHSTSWGRQARRVGLIGLLLAQAACGTPPEVPATLLIQLEDQTTAETRGAYAAMVRQFPELDQPDLQAYVSSVGARLLAHAPRTDLPVTFAVLDSPGLFAYSFGHGAIVISRGLLTHLNSEAQLASVLAHEIGHIVLKHQAQANLQREQASALAERLSRSYQTRQAQDALAALAVARLRGYSRDHELDADAWAESLLVRSGYPAGASAQTLRFFLLYEDFLAAHGAELWAVPEDQLSFGIFSTHPSTQARLERSMHRLKLQPQSLRNLPDPAYLEAIRGTVEGLPYRAGTVRDGIYRNREAGLRWRLPAGWHLFASGGKLYGATRAGVVVMRAARLQEPHAPGESPEALLKRLASRPLRGGKVLASSVPGFTAETSTPGGDELQVTLLQAAGGIWLITMDLSGGSGASTAAEREALIASIARLPPEEEGLAQSQRLHTAQHPPTTGHTLADARWALLNHISSADPIPPGTTVKVVR